MLGIISNVLLLLLVSASFPVGYFIGTYTESEIENASKRIKIEKIFAVPTILIEVAILAFFFAINSDGYFLVAGIIIVANLVLSAFHSVLKSDFVKIVEYQVIFLATSLALSSLIMLI
jgi:ABC-type phosphate transport system permease subunit